MARPQSLRFSSCGLSSLHYFLLRIIAVPTAEGVDHRFLGLGEALFELAAGDRGVVVAQREVVSQCVGVRHGGFPPFVFSPWGTVYITLNGGNSKLYLLRFRTYY